MRYLIYGAGAVGGSIGARLFQHQHDVILICRGPHLEQVRRAGLSFTTPDESVTLPIPAAGKPSEIEFRPDDVVLLTMKSQDTAAALEELRAAAGDVPVVCAQNGVANERMAIRRFSQVYGMLVILPGTHLEPGVVVMHATTIGGVLDAGRYPHGTDPLIEQICADLTESGFSAQPNEQIMRHKYAKLLQNLGNSVQALCKPDDHAGELVRLIREEALACYEAADIEHTPGDELFGSRAAKITRGAIEQSPRGGGSSWQSLARGAGSIETDYLNGEIALLGSLHGVPTPYNRAIQQIASDAIAAGIGPATHAAEEIIANASGARTATPAT